MDAATYASPVPAALQRALRESARTGQRLTPERGLSILNYQLGGPAAALAYLRDSSMPLLFPWWASVLELAQKAVK